jgi:hypothetical protein
MESILFAKTAGEVKIWMESLSQIQRRCRNGN